MALSAPCTAYHRSRPWEIFSLKNNSDPSANNKKVSVYIREKEKEKRQKVKQIRSKTNGEREKRKKKGKREKGKEKIQNVKVFVNYKENRLRENRLISRKLYRKQASEKLTDVFENYK